MRKTGAKFREPSKCCGEISDYESNFIAVCSAVRLPQQSTRNHALFGSERREAWSLGRSSSSPIRSQGSKSRTPYRRRRQRPLFRRPRPLSSSLRTWHATLPLYGPGTTFDPCSSEPRQPPRRFQQTSRLPITSPTPQDGRGSIVWAGSSASHRCWVPRSASRSW